jgi:hypothetical protein
MRGGQGKITGRKKKDRDQEPLPANARKAAGQSRPCPDISPDLALSQLDGCSIAIIATTD